MTPAETFVAEDVARDLRLRAAREVLDGLARVAEGLERASRELDREIEAVRADLARRAVERVRARPSVHVVHPAFEDRAFRERWQAERATAAEFAAGHSRRTQPHGPGS